MKNKQFNIQLDVPLNFTNQFVKRENVVSPTQSRHAQALTPTQFDLQLENAETWRNDQAEFFKWTAEIERYF